MKILIDLINYPHAGGSTYDWRYKIWQGICKELVKCGHQIWSANHRVKNTGFKTYKNGVFDYYICLSPYGHEKRTARYKQHRKAGKPVTCYDHGWLPKSIVVDRKKLFGDSHYYDTIRNLIKECPSRTSVEGLRRSMMKSHLSKRAQPQSDKIPDVPYIFVPGQVLYDASVVFYSKIGLKELIQRTLDFATQHKLHVVYKPHPGIGDSPAHGKRELERFQKKTLKSHKNFHVVNNSVFNLMQKAVFTSCVNSGSIIDNIVSLTPVYCCGKSFFSNSGTVVYDPNVERGLTKMLKKDYDAKEMKLQQLRMLWWLDKYMIQERQPVHKQVELLEMHAGIGLRP